MESEIVQLKNEIEALKTDKAKLSGKYNRLMMLYGILVRLDSDLAAENNRLKEELEALKARLS